MSRPVSRRDRRDRDGRDYRAELAWQVAAARVRRCPRCGVLVYVGWPKRHPCPARRGKRKGER
jgi:hypothetical protein